jgi:fatty acid amide hydrolase
MNTDPCRLGARRLAALVASGEASAVDVVEAHIERIGQVNPTLNAVVVPRFEAAREEAREADLRRRAGEPLGPLHGVPITVKESLDMAGLPSSFGVIAHRNDFPGTDDPVVARLRDAGAIVLGKTNVAQLLIYVETDNPLYGLTRNPWDRTRSPGGSSGGEAAIVAALGSPLGVGSDIGGSCRTPAAATGIVGFKPTAGRLPDRGRGSIPVGQLAIRSQIGFLARHVEDIALGLEIGNGGRAPPPEELRPLGDPAAVDVSSLTVGYYVHDGTFAPAAVMGRAVLEAKEHLERAGARVVPFEPPATCEALALFYQVLIGDGGRGMRRFLDGSAKDFRVAEILRVASMPRAALPLLRILLRLLGRGKLADILSAYGRYDTGSHWDAVEAVERYRERFQSALDRAAPEPVDVLLSPATALPAIHHGAAAHVGVMGSYALIYNVLGYPAGVVPVTRVKLDEETRTRRGRDKMDRTARETETGSAGLPIGVQVAARPFRDHVALAAMRVIEEGARGSEGYPDVTALGSTQNFGDGHPPCSPGNVGAWPAR